MCSNYFKAKKWRKSTPDVSSHGTTYTIYLIREITMINFTFKYLRYELLFIAENNMYTKLQIHYVTKQ